MKEYDIPAYYHVYNRGSAGRTIFHDTEDHQKFLSLVARYLGYGERSDNRGYIYPEFAVEIIAYCLMTNHYHFLMYQERDIDAISKLMHAVSTAYTMYFNKKYKQQGHLFQSTFKASRIANEAYLMHITRYIHMNPNDYDAYHWSSLGTYLGGDYPKWLKPGRAVTMSPAQYGAFLNDYNDRKAELKLLKSMLAD